LQGARGDSSELLLQAMQFSLEAMLGQHGFDMEFARRIVAMVTWSDPSNGR